MHNLYVEYRLPLFEKFTQNYPGSVFFFERFDRSPEGLTPAFAYEFNSALHLKDEYTLSPLLFFRLVRGKFNLFIAAGKGQLNTYATWFASRVLRKPFILWDEEWYWSPSTIRRLGWPIYLLLARTSKAIVIPGLKSREFYGSILTEKGKLVVAPNASVLPLDHKVKQRAQEIRASLNLADKKVVLYCGRLVERKGLVYLLEAMAKLQRHNPAVALIVVGGAVGSGSKLCPETLQKIIDDHHLRHIHFTGWVSPAEKAAYFAATDVVVVPSVFFSGGGEIWGFSVNEGMSVGKPVVTTRAVGSAYDLIDNGVNGYIVPDKDSDSIFEALKELVDDPGRQERMGLDAAETIRRGYTYEKMFVGFKAAVELAQSRDDR